ncbi:hypothetical protein E4U46_002964 [Claviceps purpurea]|nr:hypothetical protein E4U46_002964 [Claviceps purpurea]
MKTTSITIAALLASAAEVAFAAPSSCNADDCLKAVRHLPGRSGGSRAFCAKYLTPTGAPIPTKLPRNVADHCKDQHNAVAPLRVSSACGCIAQATHTPTLPARAPTPTGNSTAPIAPTGKANNSIAPTGKANAHACAQISASWAQQKKKKIDVPVVPAALAYECFNTVPLGKDEAIKLVDAIEPYLEWQSDAAFKKNPPKDYAYPGFDMFANLANVKSNLQAGKYASEYEFQIDLYKQVWAPGQDGHFVFYPDLLSKAFKFKRQSLPLVSISEDGTSLPQIKLQQEVVANAKTAQVITKINGVDAAQYLEDTVNAASVLQDADAAYNTMFWSKANAAAADPTVNSGFGTFVAGGRSAIFYPGPTTSLTFANGTTVVLDNLADVVGDMAGVTDGPSMYKQFCTSKPVASGPESPPRSPSLTGYPTPEISTQDGTVTGYYLKGQGLDDVAVITISSFGPSSTVEFQAVIMDFLSECKDAGKKKLVVDFQNNGGGALMLGYDFFRQLFPKTVQEGNSRWKLSKSHLETARVVSDMVKNVDPTAEGDSDLIELSEMWLNFRHDMNTTNNNFLAFTDKFSPHPLKETDYTSLMRFNLSDPIATSNPIHGVGIEITGYGSLTEQPQYFQPEDIVVLYDGSCSSTCTSTGEFLRHEGGVKSIAMGGRPKPGLIQGIGGVKGFQSLTFDDVHGFVGIAAQNTKDQKALAEFSRFTTLPMQRSTVTSLNVRDQILRDNIDDGTPAQFIYEPSECRLFWTAPMISDVTEIWKAAANAAFNGAKCAYGGIAGSKPGRRSEASPKARGLMRPARLSETVDKTVVKHSSLWEARHMQMAIP